MTSIVSEQIDLFISHLADIPNKDENSMMEFPFFGITKKADTNIREFHFSNGHIKIRPDREYGIPTIWDKDILVYCFNLIRRNTDQGVSPSQYVNFPIYNFLKSTGRNTGNREYKLFIDSMRRLINTKIETSINTTEYEIECGFGWVNSFKAIKTQSIRGEEIVCAVSVEISDWLYRAALDQKRSLSINPEYFNLTMGLERRFYELARKHCGNQDSWECYLTTLHEKSGSQDELKSFARQVRKIIERDSIPDYRLELETPERTPLKHKLKLTKVIFFPKAGAYAKGETTERPSMPLFDHAAAKPPALPAALTIPDQAPEAIYQEARATFRGYDIGYLWERWRGWAIGQGQPIKNQRAAFIAFCKTHAGKNPL